MTKKQRRIVGAIVKIKIKEGYYTYARTLEEASFAFYDLKTMDDTIAVEYIISKPILFIVAVYKDTVTKGRWTNIGKIPLETGLQQLPPKFIQDALNPKKFEIYDNGKIRAATKEECIGLERAAVWDPEHVEERIEDYYDGKENRWVKQMSMK